MLNDEATSPRAENFVIVGAGHVPEAAFDASDHIAVACDASRCRNVGSADVHGIASGDAGASMLSKTRLRCGAVSPLQPFAEGSASAIRIDEPGARPPDTVPDRL
jgi:hypothetical protein